MTSTFDLKPNGCVSDWSSQQGSSALLRKETWPSSGSLSWSLLHANFVQDFFLNNHPQIQTTAFHEMIKSIKTQQSFEPKYCSKTITNAPYFEPETLMYGDWLGEDPLQRRCLWIPLVALFSFPGTGPLQRHRIKPDHTGSINKDALRLSCCNQVPNLDGCFGVVIGSSRNSYLNSIWFNLDVTFVVYRPFWNPSNALPSSLSSPGSSAALLVPYSNFQNPTSAEKRPDFTTR